MFQSVAGIQNLAGLGEIESMLGDIFVTLGFVPDQSRFHMNNCRCVNYSGQRVFFTAVVGKEINN